MPIDSRPDRMTMRRIIPRQICHIVGLMVAKLFIRSSWNLVCPHHFTLGCYHLSFVWLAFIEKALYLKILFFVVGKVRPLPGRFRTKSNQRERRRNHDRIPNFSSIGLTVRLRTWRITHTQTHRHTHTHTDFTPKMVSIVFFCLKTDISGVISKLFFLAITILYPYISCTNVGRVKL